MNQQSTLEQLQELKLSGMAKRYEAILNQPVHQQPEPHALIALLAEAESGYRAYQRTQLYLRLSKLAIMQRRNRLTAHREEESLKKFLPCSPMVPSSRKQKIY